MGKKHKKIRIEIRNEVLGMRDSNKIGTLLVLRNKQAAAENHQHGHMMR